MDFSNQSYPKSRHIIFIAIVLLLAIAVQSRSVVCAATGASAGKTSKSDYQRVELERFEEQGSLSDLSIKSIIQDNAGFIWVGTQNGLNKYDGSRIIKYFADPDNPNSLVDNFIQCLFIDSDGDLWILVPGHLMKYDEKSDSFVRYRFTNERKNTHTSNPGSIVQDNEGIIWIGTPEQGLYGFDKTKGFFDYRPLNTENIDFMTFDRDGKLWIGAPGKVYILDTQKNTYLEFEVPGNEVVLSLEPDKRIIETRKQTFRLEPETGEWTKISELSNYRKGLETLSLLESDKYIWIGTRGKGLFQVSKGTNPGSHKIHENYIFPLLSDNSVRNLYEDRTGVVWVATEHGLNTINFTTSSFDYYTAKNGELASDLITAFAEDKKGRIWVSTYEGVSVFDPLNNTIQNLHTVKTENGENILLDKIRDISVSKEGEIWLLLKSSIVKYDPDTGKSTNLQIKHNNIYALDLLTIYPEGDIIWVGTYGDGLFAIDKYTGKVKKVYNEGNSDISSDYIKDIIKLKDGRFCIASLRTGMDFFNPSTEEFRNVDFSHVTSNYISDYINSVFQDSKGNIWVLSWYGAFVISPDGDIVRKYDHKDGFQSNEMTAVCEDSYGSIWLGTVNGLARIMNYESSNPHITFYTPEDGLAGNLISTGGLFASNANRRIYIGTTNGLNIFNNETFPQANKSDKPMLTGLLVNDQEVIPGKKIDGRIIMMEPLRMLSQLTLSSDQNDITLFFSAMDYHNLPTRRYAYKLEGFDNEWRFIDSKGEASYSNLSPGKYVFKVQTMSTNGSWSEETALNIRILPPWWISWWALVIYFVLALIMAFIIFRLVKKRIKERQEITLNRIEKEKANEIYEIKQQLYTNITHDMRTALTLISGPIANALNRNTIPENLKPGFEIVKKNTGYLKSLIDQVLDFRKIEIGLIKPKVSLTDISIFLKGIVEMFASYAEQKNITLETSCPDDKVSAWIDRSLMAKVVYNLIGNALKFTPEGGKILVSLYKNETTLSIKVADTGIGIDTSKIKHIFEEFYQIYPTVSNESEKYRSGSGIGLSIVKKYVELHKGQIEVESELGNGSTFTVTLPGGEDWFENDMRCDEDTETYSMEMPEIEINTDSGSNELSSGEDSQDIEDDKKLILIVDDNADIISYLKLCLREDFDIISATDGLEGMARAEMDLPDIIISDVMMPNQDGFDFARTLKSNELTRHIPILFLTAKATSEDMAVGLGLGAVDYLIKPFNEQVLISKIKNLLFDRDALSRRLKQQFAETDYKETEISVKESGEGSGPEVTVNDPLFQRIVDLITVNIESPDLSADMIADSVCLSRMQLYRKLKAVSDMTATDLIRDMRMRRAEEMLVSGEMTVSEIAYSLQFSDPFHFSKMFKKRTGVSPSDYRKSKTSN